MKVYAKSVFVMTEIIYKNPVSLADIRQYKKFLKIVVSAEETGEDQVSINRVHGV